LSGLLTALEQPLQLIDSPQRRQELAAYVSAARPQVERAAFDLLSGIVATFNDANRETQARLEYDVTGLHLSIDPVNAGGPTPEASFSDSDPERVTLRLPKELKELIDSLASRHGMSSNNWYVRELSRVIGRATAGGFADDLRDQLRDEMRAGRRGYRARRGSSLKGFVGGE
jgi:predicted HicB family RNase H-like nuclease